MKNMPSTQATTRKVLTPSHSRCRPLESARVPTAGARRATTTPAIPVTQPSAAEPATSSAATPEVR